VAENIQTMLKALIRKLVIWIKTRNIRIVTNFVFIDRKMINDVNKLNKA